MNEKSFSKFICLSRKATGLSQREYAKKLGKSWITIWRWENGISFPEKQVMGYWKDKIEEMFG